MNKRSLCILLGIAFLLGLFFQYSRLDGFLHLGTVGNRPLTERLLSPAPKEEDLPREKFRLYNKCCGSPPSRVGRIATFIFMHNKRHGKHLL